MTLNSVWEGRRGKRYLLCISYVVCASLRLISVISQGKVWDSESLNNLTETTQLVKGEARTRPSVCLISKLLFSSISKLTSQVQSTPVMLFPCMILWFIIRNKYLVFIPISGTELLKPLKFPKLKRVQRCVCSYVDDVTFGLYLRMRAGCQGNHMEGWNF